MSNTSQSQDPRSNDLQRNSRNAYEHAPPLSHEGIGQPSAMSITNNDDGTFATNLGGVDTTVKITEIGSKDSFIKARTLVVNCSEPVEILAGLTQFAKNEDMCIIGATGIVSHVEILNRQGVPIPINRDFQILSLEGNIACPKENRKNSPSWANVILVGENGLLRGGPVKSLNAKSTVQVILSTVGFSNIQSKATEDMQKDENFVAFMNHVNGGNELMNKVYEETLKELNQP